MRKFTLLLGAFVLAVFTATYATDKPVSTDVDLEKSTIEWTGAKITGQKHSGTLKLKEASLNVEDGMLKGGSFVIDMTSLTNTDDMGDDMKAKLEGHLKSDDFFSVETHPTASLNITGVEAGEGDGMYKVSADLTIKGHTHPLNFAAKMAGGKAMADIEFDRSLYEVKYGSGKFFDNLGDNLIKDIIKLSVTLVLG